MLDPDEDLGFDRGSGLPGHPDGLEFEAFDEEGALCLGRLYHSTEGGFIVTEEELAAGTGVQGDDRHLELPFPFDTAATMLRMAGESEKTIAEMKRRRNAPDCPTMRWTRS